MAWVAMSALVTSFFFGTRIHMRKIRILDIATNVLHAAILQSVLVLTSMRIMSGTANGTVRFIFCYFFLYFVIVLASRIPERILLNRLRESGRNLRHVVFVGSDPVVMMMYQDMMKSASIGYNVLGYYSNDVIEGMDPKLKLGTRDELVQMMKNGETPFMADDLFCALSKTMVDDINTIIQYCDRHIVQFYLVPRIYFNLNMQLTPQPFGDFTVFTNHTNNINRADNRFVKRIFDLVFSFVVCVLLIPFLPIVWLIVKLQSPGPLFFSQKRTGYNGREFVCYKFRSMHVNDDADKVQATKDDPRKFAFGEFMRKTNIDELPQFFNVLKGDMSVVGPRPHMLLHTKQYASLIDKYMVRHFSKPGITGWAQVTGYRGETKELWQMEERIKRDIWYNENWSFKLDLEIIFRTIWSIFFPDKNAY